MSAATQQNSLAPLKALNKYFVVYKWHFLLGIIFVSLSNYFRVLQPQIIREALDLVVNNLQLFRLFEGQTNQSAVYAQLGSTLLYLAVVVLLLALLMGVFMFLMRQTIIVMSRLIEYDLRKALFSHYSTMDTAFYKRNKTGDLMARISEDVSKVRMYLGPCILYGINLISLVVLVIYAMVSVNLQLTLYSLAPLPILSISIYYVSRMVNKKSTVIQQQLSKLTSTAQEVYSGIRVVKSYVQEKPMLRFFTAQSDTYRDKSMDLAKVDAAFYPVMLLLIGASTIITIYIGGIQVAKGIITPGNIAEFVIYINMLTWPATAIGWIASITQQASASQKRINEFLDTKPTIQNTSTEKHELQGAVTFDRVQFVYPDTGIEALKSISFKLARGEKMAIIGRTGSGKTTIADLLVRMYDVSSGRILIDGVDVRNHDLFELRRQIGYVPQDVFLFSDTVAGNVAFGRPDADRAMIEKFTKHASIYDEIEALPLKFETMVGERGVTLSGGQKQRISIARAFIKEPQLMILDDCLSAVDTNTEKRILDYMDSALANKTAIIITHRIYSLLEFDHIIVLEDGVISEQGKHDELLANGGYYADLYARQSEEEMNKAIEE